MIKTPSKFVLCFLLLCLSLVISSSASGDGKYFPERVYKATPNIPSQRAVLIYKDGVEKLIIESALEAEGKEFGWVIPVPAKPVLFEKASPGLLKTLDMVIQPVIVHDLSQPFNSIAVTAGVITLWFVLLIILKSKKALIIQLILLIVLLVLVTYVFMPTLSAGGVGMPDNLGVTVIDEQEIGSYKLLVLEAESADDLNKWLDNNGFAGLSKEEQSVVSGYIKEDWCFVTAKLKREGEGFSRPHPLMMSFPVQRAVYPMKLTGLNNQPLYLELFVISDKNALCEQLETEVCSKFTFEKEARPKYWDDGSEDLNFLPGFEDDYEQMIGHPDAHKYLWDGCVVSRLCGELEPEFMKEDFYIEFGGYQPRRKVFFSHKGAIFSGSILFLVAWMASILVLTLNRYEKIFAEGGRVFALRSIIGPSLLLSVILGGVLYLGIPKIQVRTAGRLGWIHRALAAHFNSKTLKEFGAIVFKETDKGDTSKITERLQQSKIFKESKNIYTGEDLRFEDSPGNIVIGRDGRGLFLRSYDSSGFPMDLTEEHF